MWWSEAGALRAGEAGFATREFLDMNDAYAWALHVNGRDVEALVWSDKALALGTRNALFHYHAGMITSHSATVPQQRASWPRPSRSTRISTPWPPRSAEQRLIS